MEMKVVATAYPPEIKIRVLRREIAMRRSIYPSRVSHGKMTQVEAEFEIDVMEAILKDYEKLESGMPLFESEDGQSERPDKR
jgi:hypothetical protein